MKAKSRNKGFTLVEVIVVLVILGILIALLVPALTGYIDKAREKSALAECRQCVHATQTLASEKYGQGIMMEFNDNVKKEIQDLAEVSPEGAKGIQELTWNDRAKVTRLVYVSDNDITVRYENGVYSISRNSLASESTLQEIGKIAETISVNNMDSGAVNGAYTKEFLAKLKEAGIDLEAMGARSWQYAKGGNGPFLYWSPVDIQGKDTGTKVPVMRYNIGTKTFTVWISSITEGTTGGKTFKKFGGYAEYKPSTTSPKDEQTYDKMYQHYQEACDKYK